jgi:hypothetical protein
MMLLETISDDRTTAAGEALYLNDALEWESSSRLTHRLDSPRRGALSPKRGVGHMTVFISLMPEKEAGLFETSKSHLRIFDGLEIG